MQMLSMMVHRRFELINQPESLLEHIRPSFLRGCANLTGEEESPERVWSACWESFNAHLSKEAKQKPHLFQVRSHQTKGQVQSQGCRLESFAIEHQLEESAGLFGKTANYPAKESA